MNYSISILLQNKVIMKKQFYSLLCIIVIPAFTWAQAPCSKLIFADEFNGTSIDLAKWSVTTGNGCPGLCGFGNSELQSYTNNANNIRVTDGNLVLEAKRENVNGSQFSSAKVLTQGKVFFTYGRVEARMKLPSGNGVWPAFWMLPEVSNWPTTGEIDIMEVRGDQMTKSAGTLHYGTPGANQWDGNDYYLPTGAGNFADSYHVFAVEWKENSIQWFIDGALFKSETKNPNTLSPQSNNNPWPWDKNYHIILNLAIGGWFTGTTNPNAVAIGKSTMEIDYVRVYSNDHVTIAGPTAANVGDTKTYSIASGANPNITYNWTVTAGSIVSGQGTSQISVLWNGNGGNGNVAVAAGTSACTNIGVALTGVTNPAPVVAITSPVNNTVYAGPLSVTINATATDNESVAKVEFYEGTNLLGSAVSSPYSFVWANVAGGVYSVTAKAIDNLGASTVSAPVSLAVQAKYSASAGLIPGIIEAESYDFGGQGVAYSDVTAANEGNAFRTEGADIEPNPSGFNIGYTAADEWLEYTVNVTAGKYNVDALVSSITAGNSFRIEMDGTSIGTFTVPNTGAWTAFQTASLKNVTLTGGSKIMRIYMITAGFNIDKVTFTAVQNTLPSVAITSPASEAVFNAPATVLIAASASDADGTVTKVDFYEGTNLIGSDETSPYTFTWTPVAAGSYNITAKATDNSLAAITSPAVKVIVSASTGIDDDEFVSSFILYPNPTEGIVNFGVDVKVITIYDLSGKVLVHLEPIHDTSLDLSFYQPGLYMISLQSDTENHFVKLVKR